MLLIVRAPIAMLLALAAGPGAARGDPAAAAPRDRTRVVEHQRASAVPVWGLALAPVTIDFFYNPMDYRLPALWTKLRQLSSDHPHRLRIRHHLLPEGQWLAETALEAHDQGRFFELMEEVVVNSAMRSNPHRREELCARAGIDFARAERADVEGWHVDRLERAKALMRRRRVTHNPMALLFNGAQTQEPPWQLDGDELEAAYDAAHDRAIEMLDRGVPARELYQRLVRQVDIERPVPRVHTGAVDGFQSDRHTPLRDPRPVRLGRLASRGHRRGPDNARAVVHFFCSMQSRLCGTTGFQLEEVRKDLEDEVAVVFHDLYDETDSRQPGAGNVHQMLRCAEEQGDYWTVWDLQIARISGLAPRHIDSEQILAIANGAEMDGDRLVDCVARGRHKRAVEADVAAARAAGIKRTPSLVIGGVLYQGTMGIEGIRALLLEQLRPGLLEQWAPAE